MEAERLEYRVRWQREGLTQRTLIYQTRVGAERRALVLQGRMAEVTGSDPNAYACCSGGSYAGDFCGCGGVTNGEAWAQASSTVPPLVDGPVVEARPVGAWTEEARVDG